MFGFSPPKEVKAQAKKIADELNNLFTELGYGETVIELSPQCGPIYQLIASNGKVRKYTQIILQSNPLETNFRATKKIIQDETNISSIERNGSKVFFKN